MSNYKILGTTDERTTCDNCGKTGLKSTVALDDGINVVYFGSHCAARATGKATNSGNAGATFNRALAARDAQITEMWRLIEELFTRYATWQNGGDDQARIRYARMYQIVGEYLKNNMVAV
jgi:hypothetical protein